MERNYKKHLIVTIQVLKFEIGHLALYAHIQWAVMLVIDNVYNHDQIHTKNSCKELGHYAYIALQKFGITLVSWSTRGNTATQMTIFSRISHRIF